MKLAPQEDRWVDYEILSIIHWRDCCRARGRARLSALFEHMVVRMTRRLHVSRLVMAPGKESEEATEAVVPDA